jgi:hypothetical protein
MRMKIQEEGRERQRERVRMETQGEGSDICDDSPVSFTSSKSICFYMFKPHLMSRSNFGLN